SYDFRDAENVESSHNNGMYWKFGRINQRVDKTFSRSRHIWKQDGRIPRISDPLERPGLVKSFLSSPTPTLLK
ncbi:hypothetical protein QQF64_028317, partial [Cirrhinus molitorella]